ncbi:MAG: Crp/Fnr family transcriptional regulator [Bacteroidota bacterium]
MDEFLHKFHPISDEAFGLLKASLRTATFKKGEIITREGQVQRDLYFVREGVQMSYHTHGGRQQVMAFTYPPSLSGIPESFLQQRPALYNLEALTDSTFDAISFEKLNRLFDESHEIERLFKKLTEAVLIGVSQRLFELHAFTIEERFKAFARRSPHLFELVPHKYIASYLNINPTNFSKLYNSIKF